jgi:UDP-N-acetylmuramoylalanine--D-glutamate ligase
MAEDFKKVLVVGLGYRTGVAAAGFLSARGADVTVSDMKSEDELKDLIAKLDPSVKVIAGHQRPEILDAGFDLIVLSPGVPAGIPLIQEAFGRKIPVISEIELAFRNMKGSFIGITGTDGKSTTTSLTGHIFKELGFDTFIGGNIGIPLISFADRTTDKTVTVIELSSFQLETVDTFKPDVAAILNVAPDHLDRYDGMESYFEAKKRIFKHQDNNDFFIYNRDNEILENSRMDYPSNTLTFSIDDDSADSFYRDGVIYIIHEGSTIPAVKVKKLSILGIHNIQNVMAALLMVTSLHKKLKLEPDFEMIAAACYSFSGLEHRMELAGEYMGRTFVNDSKATTIGAVEMAVKSIRDKGVLIIGGRTKGDDYSRLRDIVGEKARCIVVIGESSDMFSEIFSGFNVVRALSMEDAVAKSMKNSEEGDMILLSPACASFDMFSSYDERGKAFKESFRKLIKGEISWI